VAKNSDNVSWAHGMADVAADLRLSSRSGPELLIAPPIAA